MFFFASYVLSDNEQRTFDEGLRFHTANAAGRSHKKPLAQRDDIHWWFADNSAPSLTGSEHGGP